MWEGTFGANAYDLLDELHSAIDKVRKTAEGEADLLVCIADSFKSIEKGDLVQITKVDRCGRVPFSTNDKDVCNAWFS